jgi:hypothetical protein
MRPILLDDFEREDPHEMFLHLYLELERHLNG